MTNLRKNLPFILLLTIVGAVGSMLIHKFVVTPIEQKSKNRKEINTEGKSFTIGEKVRLKYFPEVVGVVVFVNTLTDVYTVGFVDSNNHYYTETFYPRHLSIYGN